VESHGSAGAEGVAADIGIEEAKAGEADLAGCAFEGRIDVVVGHFAPGCVQVAVDTENGGVWGSAIGQDLVNAAGQGWDWAEWRACAVLRDRLALHAGFGSGDLDGGSGSFAQGGEWSGVGDSSSGGAPESDMFDGEGDGFLWVFAAGAGVLSHTEEEVKRNVGQVGNGLLEVFGAGWNVVGPAGSEEPLNDGDGDGELGVLGWVLVFKIFEGALEALPAGAGVGI